MIRRSLSLVIVLFALVLLASAGAGAAAAAAVDWDSKGAPELQSVGPLAFGPDGVLFVGDSKSAAIFALDTRDKRYGYGKGPISVEGLAGKIAALAGTTADHIKIHDLAINPVSKQAYLSVTRGQGDEAVPLIARVAPKGEPELFELDDIRYSKASLPNPPDESETDRRGNSLRMISITDMAYIEGKLLVTGLSNEEFASKMRVLPFPFDSVGAGTSVEIYHGAHGRWETNAPVRTLTTYDIGTAPHVLAAYTCTPLVKFPISELLSDGKVMGTTVAELGNRNRPLDMIVYTVGKDDFLLMNNSSRGIMKVRLDEIADIGEITERISDTAGLKYETIKEWTGVQQLDKYGDEHAVLLVDHDGRLDLETVRLP